MSETERSLVPRLGVLLPRTWTVSITNIFSVQLFVKNIPRRRSLEEIRALFSPHGRVLDIKEHPIRAEVRYVVSEID